MPGSVDDEWRQDQNNRMNKVATCQEKREKTRREQRGSLMPKIARFDDGKGGHAWFVHI